MLRRVCSSLLLGVCALVACGESKRSQRPVAGGEGAASGAPAAQPESGAGPSGAGEGGSVSQGGSGEPADAGEPGQAGAGTEPPLFDPPKPYSGATWSSFEHVAFSAEPNGFLCSGAIVGDLDDDGFDELLLIDWSGHALTASYELGVLGAAYLFYGRSDFPAQLSVLDADLIVRGADTIARLGDIDGDGYDDAGIASYCSCDTFATGAYCTCDQASGLHLLFGGSQRHTGEARADLVGRDFPAADYLHASGLGDLNGDGYADFSFGVLPVPGASDLQSRQELSAEPTPLLPGGALSVGDVDGDDFDDLLFGSKLLYGAQDRFAAGFNTPGRLVLVGGSAQRLSGDLFIGKPHAIANDLAHFVVDHCLSGAGDVNGDGFDDVAVGIEGGGLWLVLGSPFD